MGRVLLEKLTVTQPVKKFSAFYGTLRFNTVFTGPYPLTNCMGRVLLEKLTVTQLVKKFPAFYGTRRFITVLTTAPHPFP
jgi:hypothetical protein